MKNDRFEKEMEIHISDGKIEFCHHAVIYRYGKND